MLGFFDRHQMPELYAGITRTSMNFPIQYLGANVPQAWAAGSIFAFMQAIIGYQPDAPNDMLYLDPALPDWLPGFDPYRSPRREACLQPQALAARRSVKMGSVEGRRQQGPPATICERIHLVEHEEATMRKAAKKKRPDRQAEEKRREERERRLDQGLKEIVPCQ